MNVPLNILHLWYFNDFILQINFRKIVLWNIYYVEWYSFIWREILLL